MKIIIIIILSGLLIINTCYAQDSLKNHPKSFGFEYGKGYNSFNNPNLAGHFAFCFDIGYVMISLYSRGGSSYSFDNRNYNRDVNSFSILFGYSKSIDLFKITFSAGLGWLQEKSSGDKYTEGASGMSFEFPIVSNIIFSPFKWVGIGLSPYASIVPGGIYAGAELTLFIGRINY